MKCTCTEDEICESHRLVWDFQMITQKLANQLETELNSQKLYNQLPTTELNQLGDKDNGKSRSVVPITIPERV